MSGSGSDNGGGGTGNGSIVSSNASRSINSKSCSWRVGG